jgi:stringent starvation protein B
MADSAEKMAAFQDMLERGLTMLHLDARQDVVDVPEHFRQDHHLRLNYSYRFFLDTFEIDEQGVQASLSFGGIPHLTTVPWNAVFACSSHVTGEWRVWPDDMPVELMAQAVAFPLAPDLAPPPTTPSFDEAISDEDLGEPARRVGHLRVIK